jgi:hypothetical protein
MLDCEWNIEKGRPFTHKEFVETKPHAKAVWFFGHDKELAICDECAKSAKLRRFTVRRLIKQEAA